MRGIWRIRQALDRLESLGSTPEPEAEVEEPVSEPEVEAAPPRLPKGLWMAKQSPWAYVVVPKAACTTAGQYLYFADHGYYYYDDVHQLRYGLFKAGVDPASLGERMDEVGDELFTFTFVRDPYSRLVSAFLDKIVDLEQRYRPDIRDRVASDWGVQLAGDRSQVDNFKSFMRFVDDQYTEWDQFQQAPEDGDHRAAWQKVDIHWLRQSWYLRRGRRSAGTVDFIGTTETMNTDMEQLNGVLSPTHAPVMAEMPRFGAGPKRDAPLEDYFDAETKAIVDKHFGADFRLFGYPTVVGAAAKPQDGFARAAHFEAQFEAVAVGESDDVDDEPSSSS